MADEAQNDRWTRTVKRRKTQRKDEEDEEVEDGSGRQRPTEGWKRRRSAQAEWTTEMSQRMHRTGEEKERDGRKQRRRRRRRRRS